ncbi:NAD(P)-dependent alcohol dehydrogenase [Streptomyces sp. SID10853]|uniref:NAD(P)-dependent alcohol dehydrogenase n=1 Tax=Streptomyces sp. SID10853 TaxID=2706028 RepID=UPI0013C02596|nr:NAD(P)-dependent alcohol dehydrogenase [Streptomyces sp. SID10853]NDZ79557.1 NAD(P)-dependent alcohol dehydrogenase [Streptomyces sp. SID10853]
MSNERPSPPSTMRSAQYHSYGDPDVLSVNTIATPTPAPGEVLVRVVASGVSNGELRLRQGGMQLLTGRRFPKGVGGDFAGTVAVLGDDVTGFKADDAVWGLLPRNVSLRAQTATAADYVVVPATSISRMPNRLTFAEAAALPVVGQTAMIAVKDTTHIREGESVLVRGATGGVGLAALQFAVAAGGMVTALIGRTGDDVARELGASHVLHRDTPLARLPKFDVIIDTVGTELLALRRHLNKNGRMAAVTVEPPLRGMLAVAVSRVHSSRRIRFSARNPDTAVLTRLAAEVQAGHLKPVIADTYPLEHIADAHRDAERGTGAAGKRIIALTDDATTAPMPE